MFQLTDTLAPGQSTLLGDTRGPAVEVDITEYVLSETPILYLNRVEACEIAAPFGVKPLDEFKALEQQLTELQADLGFADSKVTEAHETLAAFRLASETTIEELRAEVRRLEAEMDEMEMRVTKKTGARR